MDLTGFPCHLAILVAPSRLVLGAVGAFFIGDSIKRAVCLKFFRKLALRSRLLCVQETHGLPFEVFTELGILFPGWRALHSSCLDVHGIDTGAAGGVAVLICLNIVKLCYIKHTVLVSWKGP